MNKRSLIRLYDKWWQEFWHYKTDAIGGVEFHWSFQWEERSDIKPGMEFAYRCAVKNGRMVEHTLVVCVEAGLISTLEQADEFLRMQVPAAKGKSQPICFSVAIDIHRYPWEHLVSVPQLEFYPFWDMWRVFRCDEFHIVHVPKWRWTNRAGSEAVRVVQTSFDMGFGGKHRDLCLSFDFRDKKSIADISGYDLHRTKIPGMRLRRLDSLR